MKGSIITGFVVSFGALCTSILIDSHFEFEAILGFFNLSAMIIIFGGISGVIIVAYTPIQLKEIGVAIRKAFFEYADIEMIPMAMDMLNYAQKARQEGPLALEPMLPEIKDEWLRRGMQLIVDGADPKAIQNIMEIELEEYSHRVGIGARIFSSLGGYSPTLGIIGTVMGLVHMLKNLSDPSRIGAMIAVAFLATFWGILSANLIFLPIADRVKSRDNELIATRMAMIEAILSIQAGESIRITEEKLMLFMPPEKAVEFVELRLQSGDGRQTKA